MIRHLSKSGVRVIHVSYKRERFQMSFATLDFIRHVLTFHDTFVIQYLGKQDIHDKQRNNQQNNLFHVYSIL